MAALTTLVTGLVGEIVTWGFEEMKRAVEERREAKKQTKDGKVAEGS
jgi:hypothetical protein